ncbi:hypothetical protein K505DRAFT_229634 [Melanomma pulvis-pyrius CBS 109.77]|uniref:Uncharacterized protein n=1 Tax=Melanomma pulvis-pyrius CBS 109.77 TaxID=1314802 RepID=A0A6A6XUY2_9PLEO|nr:hypothetical protein K505DRAFT_229634 [Melanomma pulvis-pyrius CBS 109.77]
MTDNETLKAESVQDEAPQELVSRPSSTDTERPPSTQRVNQDAQNDPPSEHEEVLENEESDPAANIADFDWEELALRYHGDIRKCEGNEAELMQEWEELMNYFRIWAESGHAHETDRTFSRFQTRISYVQNSEDKLERTRIHYTNVVKAFESAMSLLSNIN